MTDLTCRACGHKHTQADWEYQAGHCHACGAPLEIPHDDPSYAQWVTGPKSKAAVDLERAAALQAISEPDPGPLPPPGPDPSQIPDDDDESDDDEDDEDDEDDPVPEPQLKIPDDVKVDQRGKVIPKVPAKVAPKAKKTVTKRRRRK